jgi:hypothetical protein
MNGVCGLFNSYGDLDVGVNGEDWNGHYPE